MEASQSHTLSDKWTLWAHLPHDTDWSEKSYIKINDIETVEDAKLLYEKIPDDIVLNCMLFLMLDDVLPMWEDKNNCKGGCFSYKIKNCNVFNTWWDLVFCLLGKTISSDNDFIKNITGITISPKKNFCIVKIWLKTCEYKNPNHVVKLPNLDTHGCLFKKHNPEY
tara:strand:+ start:606 stop:1103 length:498 start_codon:yes stop_codon:yes gene_type:complete